MEQRKVQAKDVFLLLGAIGAALGLYLGVQIAGMIVVIVYFIAVQGYGVWAAVNMLYDSTVLMGLTCFMHVSFVLAFGIWYKFGFVKKNKIPFKQVYGIRNLACFVVLGFGLQFFISYVLELVNILFPAVMEDYMRLLESMDIGNSFITLVVTVCLAPIGEELMFRGVIMGYAKRVMPFVWANLLQAILFGVYHMNLVQGMYAFAMGLLFGYLVKKCDSLLASVAVHFVVNGSANLLTLLFSGESGATETTETMGLVPVLAISGISAVICGVACYFVNGRKKEQG